MIPSPLALETHVFTKLHVDACPEACDEPGTGSLSSNVEFMQHEEDENKWMLSHCVRQEEGYDDEGCPEYTFDVQVVGFFEVDKDYPQEKAEQLVKANAPAILYSSVREMILNVTGRGPFAACSLPTVSFIDEASKSS